MASVALNLYSVRPEVTVDPHLRFAPVALRLNAESWLALNADEAAALGQQLLDAAASLRLPEGVILTGNNDLVPAEHQSLGSGVDSLGHGFDRRREAA